MFATLLTTAALAADGSGRSLFLSGRTLSRIPVAEVRGTGIELPATQFACSSCHGRSGGGGTEGGVTVPAIDGPALKRAGYSEAMLSRTLRDGIGSSATPLHPAMPAYRLTDPEVRSLFEFLNTLPAEAKASPGVSDSAVRVGAALPLSGPMADVGLSIRAALDAVFRNVRIYGRRVELVTQDSQQGSAMAFQALIKREKVFALVGSLIPSAAELDGILKQTGTPVVGPLTALSEGQSPSVYYMMPALSDQVRVLADYLNDRGLRRPAVAYGSSLLFDALREQLAKHRISLVWSSPFPFGITTKKGELVSAKPDCVLSLGGEADFEQVARTLDAAGLDVPIVSTSATAGRVPFALPARMAQRLILAHGALLREEADLPALQQLLKQSGGELTQPALQAAASASAIVFLEALKRCGQDLTQPGLRAALETLQEFRTGLTPPVTFAPGRTVGSSGAYIVGVDTETGRYVPLTRWLVPQN